MDFGLTLRRLRDERGLSLRGLGERAHYSYGYLHDLEHGRKQPTRENATRLDEALEADGELIALVAPPPAGPTVAMLQSAGERYQRMYRQVGGAAIRSRVATFFNTHAAPLLNGHSSDATNRELFTAAGRLAAVAGICAFDSEAQRLARESFQQALDLANAGKDGRLAAYVFVLMANQEFIAGEYPNAFSIAEAGLRVVGAHLTPALRTDLHLTQAKSYACVGAGADTRRHLQMAEQTAAQIRSEQEPPEANYVQPGLIELQLAEALAHLDDLAPAREYASFSVRTPAHPRGHVQRLATLAKVDLRSGEIDQAAASAIAMVDAAAGMESYQLRKRFRELRDGLATAGTPEAAEAVERVNEWLTVPL